MGSYISEVVKCLIAEHSTNDPFFIANNLKIHIIPWSFPEEIKGMYKYERKNKFIFYNQMLPTPECNFVVAHELGHAVLHPTHNTSFLHKNTLFSVNKYEKQANLFAVELMLPDAVIHNFKDTRLTMSDIVSMHGIPKELAYLKNIDSLT